MSLEKLHFPWAIREPTYSTWLDWSHPTLDKYSGPVLHGSFLYSLLERGDSWNTVHSARRV